MKNEIKKKTYWLCLKCSFFLEGIGKQFLKENGNFSFKNCLFFPFHLKLSSVTLNSLKLFLQSKKRKKKLKSLKMSKKAKVHNFFFEDEVFSLLFSSILTALKRTCTESFIVVKIDFYLIWIQNKPNEIQFKANQMEKLTNFKRSLSLFYVSLINRN